MNWIYLSPHLDDAIFSCGGLMWQQHQRGEPVSVWTVCGADPEPGPVSDFAAELHTRWGTLQDVVPGRRSEDGAACALLGATPHYFAIKDCIYRRDPDSGRYLYTSNEALFGAIDPADAATIVQVTTQIKAMLPEDVRVICPLAIGGHVDHQLTRQAAQGLGIPLWYYADIPYVLSRPQALDAFTTPEWRAQSTPIGGEDLFRWGEAAAAYVSQVPDFWPDRDALNGALGSFCEGHQGIPLWEMKN
jgi:hypothetical protein